MSRPARLLIAAALCLVSGWALTGVARADGTVRTVSFTGSGPSPAALTIRDGDRVQFRNDIDPSASVPVLGPAAGAFSSVSVTVTGATSTAFTLERGTSVTVGPYHSGTTPLVARYSSRYDSTLVLGSLPGPSEQTGGSVTVAARRAGSAPSGPGRSTTSGPVAPAHSPAVTTPAAPPSAPARQLSDRLDSGAALPTVHFTPQAPNVAAQVVPRGNAGPYRSAGPKHATASGPATSPASTGAPTYAADPGDPPMHPAAASGDVPGLPFPIDWTAVIAVVLVSAVAAVLVRTLVVHRTR